MAHPELMRTGARPLISEIVILAIILIIAITVGAIVVLAIVNSWFNSGMAVLKELIPGTPTYITIGPGGETLTFEDWAAYLSAQHAYYWYVCPKCGAGYGSKAAYPNITDVPAEEKTAFDEHVSICQGIPQTNYSYVPMFVWAIIGVSAGVVVLYIVMKMFTSKTTERIVERARY
jgi:hypothetical protein